MEPRLITLTLRLFIPQYFLEIGPECALLSGSSGWQQKITNLGEKPKTLTLIFSSDESDGQPGEELIL